MTAVAHGWIVKGRVGLRWVDGIRKQLRARRDAGLDRKLIPVETRFFDAYCRGGARQWETLAVDYSFINRPRVRQVLRNAVDGVKLGNALLEDEFTLWDPRGDLSAFRSNLGYLSQCIAGLR